MTLQAQWYYDEGLFSSIQILKVAAKYKEIYLQSNWNICEQIKLCEST